MALVGRRGAADTRILRLLRNTCRFMTRKVFIKTHGCQMNEYDSAKMMDVLSADGPVEATKDPKEADILLLNTCSIREKAQEKSQTQAQEREQDRDVFWKHRSLFFHLSSQGFFSFCTRTSAFLSVFAINAVVYAIVAAPSNICFEIALVVRLHYELRVVAIIIIT